MLTIKNLTIKDLKNHEFIKDFNYSLGNQDKVGIIGEEGNGKSTFLKAIYDKKKIEDNMVMSGEILHDFHHIGYLSQQLPTSWEDVVVYEYLLKETVEDVISWEQYNDLKQYESLCNTMHLPVSILQQEQTMKTLSGGEKVKVQILKLLHQHVDLLLLDEPTNDLDISTLQWMETFIKESCIPVLFISHDVNLLQEAANIILHFEQLNKQSKCQVTIFRGKYHEYIESRTQRLQKEHQVAHKEKQEYKKKKVRLNNQKNAVHDALNDTVRNPGMAALLKKKMASIKAMEARYAKEHYRHVDSREDEIVLFFQDIESYEHKHILEMQKENISVGNRILIKDIHLLIKGKDKVLFIGDNGCGKSMLMKAIYQSLKKRKDIQLGYMPQNYQEQMDMSMTPVEYMLDTKDKADMTRGRDLLGRIKFTSEEMTHRISQLSEGQKAKLYLVKFIKQKCNVLLLDEPTRNLSPLSSTAILSLLKDYTGCIISISHDRTFIEQIDGITYEIKNQKLHRNTHF